MLVLSRKPQETIVVDGRISITVVEVRGNQVRLGIEAPKDVSVQRLELREGTGTREIVLPLVRAQPTRRERTRGEQNRVQHTRPQQPRPQHSRRVRGQQADFRSATPKELFEADLTEDTATSAAL